MNDAQQLHEVLESERIVGTHHDSNITFPCELLPRVGEFDSVHSRRRISI